MKCVVADTNVLVSALQFGGKPKQLLDLAIDGQVDLAVSETSNSSPRTIRGNAWMTTGTSSKSNSNVRGLTVPSLSPCVCPRVTSAVLSLPPEITWVVTLRQD